MWQSMSPEQLEKQYSPSKWVGRMSVDIVVDHHVETLTATSEKVRSKVHHTADISYGSSDVEKLDLFIPKQLPQDAPIFVYIHGGYWQALSKNASCYMAGSFTQAGAGVAVVGYELAPKATMETIVSQCHAAVKYVLKWAAKKGCRGVYFCGHSAGGHLVAMMASYDYKKLLGDTVGSLLKGVIPVSGVFDVRPLVRTTVNDPLKLTEETAWENSPDKFIDQICEHAKGNDMEVLVAAGESDSPEFRRQSKEFTETLKSNGVNVRYVEIPEVDHFNVIEKLAEEDYSLTKEVFKVMKLSQGN